MIGTCLRELPPPQHILRNYSCVTAQRVGMLTVGQRRAGGIPQGMGGQLQQRPAKWYCRMQLQDSQREQQVLQQLNYVLCRCCIIRLDDCCGAGRRLADSDLQVAGGAVAPGGNKAEKTTITALLPSHPGKQSLQPAPACLPAAKCTPGSTPAPARGRRCLPPGHETGSGREGRPPHEAWQSWPREPARCGR